MRRIAGFDFTVSSNQIVDPGISIPCLASGTATGLGDGGLAICIVDPLQRPRLKVIIEGVVPEAQQRMEIPESTI